MTDIVVRAAKKSADAEAIGSLIRRTVQETNSADYPPEIIQMICLDFSVERVRADMARRDVFVAMCDGNMAGTISLGDNKLHALFVTPGFQRRGIATRLVAHIEMLARMKNLEVLMLSSSITARPLYETLGYQIVIFEERNNGSTWLMRKTLVDE